MADNSKILNLQKQLDDAIIKQENLRNEVTLWNNNVDDCYRRRKGGGLLKTGCSDRTLGDSKQKQSDVIRSFQAQEQAVVSLRNQLEAAKKDYQDILNSETILEKNKLEGNESLKEKLEKIKADTDVKKTQILNSSANNHTKMLVAGAIAAVAILIGAFIFLMKRS